MNPSFKKRVPESNKLFINLFHSMKTKIYLTIIFKMKKTHKISLILQKYFKKKSQTWINNMNYHQIFKIIWEFIKNFAKYTNLGTTLFWYFVIVWGLYGVAACLSYKLKNVSYNILDLFAKNFFGLFLAYLLYSSYTK